MSSETIWQELELFRQKIAYFFGQFLLFARQLIRDPSIVPRGDLVLMGAPARCGAWPCRTYNIRNEKPCQRNGSCRSFTRSGTN